MAMIKLLTRLISYSTKCRHKQGVHSNNTSSDFALKVSFSIVKKVLLLFQLGYLNEHMPGKELSIFSLPCLSFCELLSFYLYSSFSFGLEGGMFLCRHLLSPFGFLL